MTGVQTCALPICTSRAIAGIGTTTSFNGYLKGIVTGITTDATNGNSTGEYNDFKIKRW